VSAITAIERILTGISVEDSNSGDKMRETLRKPHDEMKGSAGENFERERELTASL